MSAAHSPTGPQRHSYKPASPDVGTPGPSASEARGSHRSVAPNDAQRQSSHGPPGVRGLVVLAVISCIALLLHVYPAWRLLTSADIMSTGGAVLTGVVAAAVMVLLLVCGQLLKRDLASAIGVTWLGVIFQLFVWTLIGEVLRFALWATDVDEGGRIASAAVLVWTLLVLTYGSWRALARTPIRETDIHIPRLHRDLDGLRIVQVTDTHLSRILGTRWMAARVRQINGIDADIYCHTGDLADGDPKLRLPAAKQLADVRAEHKYFITGNHEYFSDAVYWGEQMTEFGWRFLHNTHEVYQRGEGRLIIAGIDDPTGRSSGIDGHGPRLADALSGVDPDLPVLLLAHQPKQSADAAAHQVDLQLAGHTHGGQMWPFHHIVRADQKYVHGLHAVNERTQIYVSRGTGFWGPPFRIGAPPETAVLTLRAAAAPAN
ncbi:metallophosphoesterase [Cumulibacter soli]|uniref:metallophosphoesterase n=1 Tax=Cumulibacter soli TaxID=2546344 RepID=UPI0010674FD0|nr:metallophosphoesterase [Cumulibacter soli]